MATAENVRNKLKQHCRAKAEKYLTEGNNLEAFDHFLVCAKLSPDQQVNDGLIFTLREIGLSLEKNEKHSELFELYKKALTVVPNSAEIQNNLGAHLVRFGDFESAAYYFLQALTLNPSFVSAKENLDNISNTLMERWHFPMLNDKRRNEMYNGAIEAAVKQGFDTVLDIGAGTGILSMFAVRGGAKQIYACEMSDFMYQIARKVLENNEMDKKISLHHRFSMSLQIPQDLENRVSLVVTEIVDSGLLGEGVLLTLDDAWTNVLQPSGRVIPCGATIFATCIECETIRIQNRILKSRVCDINLNSLSDERAVDFLPYTTENLDAISKDVNFLTRPVVVTRINFNDPQEIKKYLKGVNVELDTKITQTGIVDALVMWFNLHLDDERILSTANNTCWEQAVYPVNSRENIRVETNSTIKLRAEIDENSLKLRPIGVRINSNPDTKWGLNHNDILRLNDDRYWELITKILTNHNLKGVNLLDLTSMPLAALAALKMNAKEVTITEKYELIQHLANVNKLNKNKIKNSNHEDSSLRAFDVIIMDLVEPTGILRQDILETLALLKFASKNAIFIPNRVTVRVILIESPSLLKMNRLIDDENVLGFKIANTINQFKVTNHIDINLKQIPHKLLCESIDIIDFDFTDNFSEITNTCNVFNVQITSDGTINAVLVWFQLHYGKDIMDTFENDCFWKQMCVMLEKSLKVKPGQNVTIKAECSHSCITITVE